jgi:L-ascorbate metabolism protein UlaG (beta-lactamase superfamily)
VSGDRITYVGHATALIELSGTRVLTDPMLRSRVLRVIVRHGAEPTPEVAERIDAVLISHLHHDHLDFGSLRRIGTEAPVIVPPGGARVIRRRRSSDVIELGAGEAIRVGEVEVMATSAVHDGRRYKIGPAVEAIGFLLRSDARSVYFAGDTDLFAGMGELAGDLEAALLPIGGWGPRTGAGHLDPGRAAEAAAMLRPRLAIPIHWGTLLRFDLGRRADELLHAPARRFVAELAERAPGVRAAVLDPGESLELPRPPPRSR